MHIHLYIIYKPEVTPAAGSQFAVRPRWFPRGALAVCAIEKACAWRSCIERKSKGRIYIRYSDYIVTQHHHIYQIFRLHSHIAPPTTIYIHLDACTLGMICFSCKLNKICRAHTLRGHEQSMFFALRLHQKAPSQISVGLAFRLRIFGGRAEE